MNFYLTTDTHFFHEKIKLLSDRPDDFECKILNDWFKTLQKDDVLIHLGDICLGSDTDCAKHYIEIIKCKKWLIKGNHDNKSCSWYLDHGWSFVSDRISIKRCGFEIILSHAPIDSKMLDFCDMNIHGHFHNKERDDRQYEKPSSKYRRLSIEREDYKLVKLDDFVLRN